LSATTVWATSPWLTASMTVAACSCPGAIPLFAHGRVGSSPQHARADAALSADCTSCSPALDTGLPVYRSGHGLSGKEES
jgi:hypothetical protein